MRNVLYIVVSLLLLTTYGCGKSDDVRRRNAQRERINTLDSSITSRKPDVQTIIENYLAEAKDSLEWYELYLRHAKYHLNSKTPDSLLPYVERTIAFANTQNPSPRVNGIKAHAYEIKANYYHRHRTNHNEILKLHTTAYEAMMNSDDMEFLPELCANMADTYTQMNDMAKAALTKEDFTDIRFNPNASFVLDGKVYLGSDIGVLKIDPFNANATKWIIFNSNVSDIRMALITGSFVLILIITTLVAYRRKKAAHRKMIRMQIDDLHKRLEGLSAITGLDNGNDKVNIDTLKKELEQLCVNHKNINEQITMMSEKIMQTNRNIGIKLSKLLNKQIEQIAQFDAYEMPTLIEESHEAEATDNTEYIMQQVVKNEKWLTMFTTETERLEEYRRNVEGTIMIEGVTDIMVSQLAELTESIRHKKLSELREDIRQLDRQYRYLFSRDALKKAEQYITTRREKIAPMAETDEVAAALVTHIDRQIAGMGSKDRIEMLRELYLTDCRINQMLIRKEIADNIREYTELRESVISENEKRVVKKFDTKLELEIADHTSFITENIERLIASFYRYMEKTDKEIMNTVLKFPNLSAQSPKVLVLLIADAKVKRVCLPGILGMFGNMNPVISRLINNRLKPGQDLLKEYAEKHPTSMVCYILKLTE